MIRNLQGIHETVDYKADTQICLYYNMRKPKTIRLTGIPHSK